MNLTYDCLKIYRVRHSMLEEQTVAAESAQEACEKLGWMIGNCHVKIIFDPNDFVKPTPTDSVVLALLDDRRSELMKGGHE
jgi:urease accessory protein UreE